MSPQPAVLLMSDEAATVQAVSAALTSDGRPARHSVCRSLSELSVRLERETPRAVLVDIDPQPQETLAQLEPLISQHSEMRFLVLSQHLRNDLVLEAMQVGSRHFLVKPAIAAELPAILKRILSNGHAAAPLGTLLTVLSAGGGCGATTLAVSMASELTLMSSQPALVVDMDAHYGSVATFLGLSGQYGLLDVLTYPSGVDAQLVRSSAVQHETGLHVLLSPASTHPEVSTALDCERLPVAIQALRYAYRHIVVDAPRVPWPVIEALAQASRLTFLLFQLTVRDVCVARQMLSGLARRGFSAGRVLAVASRYRRRKTLVELDEARRALGDVEVVPLRNDFSAAMKTMNEARPLTHAAPRSRLRRDARALIQNALRVTADVQGVAHE